MYPTNYEKSGNNLFGISSTLPSSAEAHFWWNIYKGKIMLQGMGIGSWFQKAKFLFSHSINNSKGNSLQVKLIGK